MSTFKRIAISNRQLCSVPLPEQVLRLQGAVDMLILREKDLTPEEYCALAKNVRQACQTAGIKLICHTFVSAAEEIGCDSIHLPFPQFWQQKEALSSFAMVGVSAHSLEEVQLAEKCGADYVIVSNIFATSCKEGVPGKGLSFLREACKRTALPVYALGGITAGNEAFIRLAGADGACRMSGYMW